jgi:zinc protease
VARPIDDKPVTFPYLPEPLKEGVIVRKTKTPDIGILQIDYQNGVRLNLKKTDFKANEVLVNLSIGSGKFSEPTDKPGLGALSTSVINESGLGSLTKDEIRRAMTGKSTSVVFSVGGDRFYFKGRTVTQEVTLLFQLLHAYLVDPGYREDAYTITMDRFRQSYQKLSSSIEGAMTLYGRRFLAGEDSRFGLPIYEKFKKLALDDVRLWLNTSWQNDIEVSVVGDFDIALIEKIAAKYLGNLSFKKRERLQKKSKLIQFPIKQTKKISVETKIPKGLVVVAYPTEDLWNISRTRRFSILADIVSERLREKIREKLGSAYSTYAFNQASRTYEGYGVFQIIIHIDPREAEMIIREVKKIISDLIENGVTQEELKRAIAPTLTSIKDMMRKNNYWLNTVLTGSKKYPQQIEWSRTIMKDYASITKEDVSLLAKKYLANERAATIIVKPK